MRAHHDDYKVVVSMGTCGISAGARPVLNGFVEEIATLENNKVNIDNLKYRQLDIMIKYENLIK